MLVLEVSPQAVNWERLTCRQEDAAAGLYAVALAGFLRWLAGRYDQVRELMADALPELRRVAGTAAQHRRTPGIVADLYLGLDLFCEFAADCG